MSVSKNSEKISLNGPAGALQVVIEYEGDSIPEDCVVVCHPHPLHGGTMDNKVAYMLAKSFTGLGFCALRFNFRGVGESEGVFDDGIGEVGDALAVLEYALANIAKKRIWLAGFSFGAAVAIKAAGLKQVDGLVSVAPAVSRFVEHDAPLPDCPWLIVHGEEDELVPVEETIAWVNELDPGPELALFEGTEHFFHGRLNVLRETVQDFVSI